MLFQEVDRHLDRTPMRLLDLPGERARGQRPHHRYRLHRGEGQVITSHRLRLRRRVSRDETRQLPGIERCAAVLLGEHLPT